MLITGASVGASYGHYRHVLASLLINGVPGMSAGLPLQELRADGHPSCMAEGPFDVRPRTLKQPLAQLRAVAILALHILNRCPFGGRRDKVVRPY